MYRVVRAPITIVVEGPYAAEEVEQALVYGYAPTIRITELRACGIKCVRVIATHKGIGGPERLRAECLRAQA